MKKNFYFTNTVSVSTMLIALAFIFSNIKLFSMPLGGSITLFSMLIISLPGYLFGFKYGLISTIIYGFLQFIYGRYMFSVMQVILDYILAFGSFSIVGLFKNKKYGLFLGFTLGCILRCFFSSLSGVLFFADYTPEGFTPVIYSIVYNASYIFAEMILSYIVIALPIFHKLLSIYLPNQKS